MATESVLERIYRLLVDGTQAEKSLRDISGGVKDLHESFAKAGEQVTKFAAGFGVALGVTEIVEKFHAVIEAMDETLRSSEKLGLSVRSMQEWSYALKVTGVDAGTFATAVGKVAKGIEDLDAGNITKQTTLLKGFGVTAKDTADQALEKLVAGFAALEPGPLKTAYALEVFGKAGKDMIPLLNTGSNGIQQMRTELGLLNKGFTDEDAKRAREFSENMTKLGEAAKASAQSITNKLLPALNALSGALVDNIKKMGFWAGLASTIWQGLTNQLATPAEKIAALEAQIERLSFTPQLKENNRILIGQLNEQIAELKKVEVVEADRDRENAKFDQKRSDIVNKQIADAKKIQDQKEKDLMIDKLIKDSMDRTAQERGKANVFMMKENEKWIESSRHMAEESGKSFDLMRTKFADPSNQLDREAKARFDVQKKLVDQSDEWNKQQMENAVMVDELRKKTETGTAAQQQYAYAQLQVIKAQEDAAAGIKKQTTELDILNKGYEDFFTNLGTGVANASDIFKRAVQSIIADLLKLWAKKYIVQFVMGMFGGPQVGPSAGGSRQELQGMTASTNTASTQSVGVSAFSSTTPDSMPANQSGALVPLSRGPQNNSGPAVQVNVHNNAGAQVDVQSSDDGSRIDIIIERTRRALAADVRTGGSAFSGALESTYALGRGRA